MSAQRTAGAIAGALAVGAGMSAMMMMQEKQTGKPSELTDLERSGATKLGIDTPAGGTLPGPGEQAVSHGGHLLLSVLGGVAYAALTDEDVEVLPSGIGFGLAFYGAAHWIVAPVLGLKRPEWKSDLPTIGMHLLNHVVFGVATAAGAKAAAAL